MLKLFAAKTHRGVLEQNGGRLIHAYRYDYGPNSPPYSREQDWAHDLWQFDARFLLVVRVDQSEYTDLVRLNLDTYEKSKLKAVEWPLDLAFVWFKRQMMCVRSSHFVDELVRVQVRKSAGRGPYVNLLAEALL